jgi:hypothetical protein
LGPLAARYSAGPRRLQKLDDLKNLPDLEWVGDALGARVSLDHSGSFVRAA